ncbi:AIR synthase related protein [Streptomyces sp. E11-3]|uniref:AIR synthase related protein n=1 Tax=Streptomyces sp. E11-3 TaxID=3110112 RepID=UPI00397EA8BC
MASDVHPLPHRQVALGHEQGGGQDRELTGMFTEVLGPVHGAGTSVPPPDPGHELAVATGSFAVDPPFFGDADMGRVAVCALVNELAAAGAEPRALALSLIVEAGLPVRQVRRLAESVRDAAAEAGVQVVAVDTRVVRAGDADRVFVAATGFGQQPCDTLTAPAPVAGDRIVLSGRLGGYAAHVLSTREGLGFEVFVPSGCAPLNGLLTAVRTAAGPDALRAVRVLGGGLAATLDAAARDAGLLLRIEPAALAIQYEAQLTFDTLGVDPLRVAEEGCLCLFVARESAATVLAALRAHPYGQDAQEIGEVTRTFGPGVELLADDGTATPLQADGTDGAGGSAGSEPARLR